MTTINLRELYPWYSIPKLNFNVLDKNKKSEPIPYRNQVRISQVCVS